MNTKLYIAYGSNLNLQQMKHRCPTARPVAKRTLENYRLVFQGHPYGAHANVIPENGQRVPVVIWKITDMDEARLDIYEGVAGGYYTKEYIEVEVNDKVQKALIYIMTPHGYGLPGDNYLNTIKEGYRDFGLPVKILNDAVLHSYKQRDKQEERA